MRGRKRWSWWQEIALIVIVAVVLSALLKSFVVQMFFVPTGSMRPLFVHQDHILVQKVSFWTGGDIQRGDVVVFDDPDGRWLRAEGTPRLPPLEGALAALGLFPTSDHLVKRVIGVGGDHVKCCDAQGRITVNGVPLHEKSYLIHGAKPSTIPFNVVVPPGRLWVMGDNRPDSSDSRYHQELPGGGTVPVDDVVGKVWAIVWPFHRAHLLHRPATFANPALR